MARVFRSRPVEKAMSRRSIVAYEKWVDSRIAEMQERLVAIDDERVLTVTRLEVWAEVKHMLTQISPPVVEDRPITIPRAGRIEDEDEESA